ncbi:MAG: glycosyltransferase family 2 protein [Holophagae bacterium]
MTTDAPSANDTGGSGDAAPPVEYALSVVIPALNEHDRLPPTLRRIGEFLVSDSHWRPAEIIVVDDGSTDETTAAARAVEIGDDIALVVVAHADNRGKGAATRTGFANSRGAWVLLTDADLAAPIEEVAVLAEHTTGRRTIAVGSRAVDRRLISERQPWYRDLMGRTFNLAVRSLGLSHISDTQCGFKLFPGEIARALAAVQRLDGFAFDVEHLTLCGLWGIEVKEVGVRWRHVEESRVLAARHSAQMLRDIMRLWWWRQRGHLPRSPEAVR